MDNKGKMADCLLECLREARLEKYHRNFVNGGLRHCDALIHLSMQEYPKYGVVSMEDRLKLFKLIEIVKSVHSEGLVCHHGKHTHAKQGHMANVDTRSAASKKQTNVIKINTNHGKIVQNRRQLPQAPHQVSTQDAPALRRSASMRQVNKVDAPPLRRSGSMRQTNAPTSRRSASATRVEYKPNSDSPIFHCRRQLKFTDSDLESDEDDFPTARSSKSAQSKINTQTDSDTKSGDVVTNESVTPREPNSDKGFQSSSKPVRATSIFSKKVEPGQPLHVVSEPKVRAFNIEKDMKPEISPEESARHILKNGIQISPYEPYKSKSTASAVTATGVTMINVEARKSAFSTNVKSKALQPKSSTDDMSHPVLSQQQAIQPTAPHNQNVKKPSPAEAVPQYSSAFHSVQPSTAHGTQSIIQNSGQRTEINVQPDPTQYTTAPSHPSMPVVSQHVSNVQPFQFKNFVPTNAIVPGQHSYFPTSAPQAVNQRTSVEKTYYGTEYNYGVPNTANTVSTQNGHVQRTEQNTNVVRNDKIRVCVRKRPLLNIEAQRGEVDIVKTDGINSVVVEECKLAVDLSKVIHQHIFKFDEVFQSDCGNDSVYKRSVKPLVQFAFNKGTATCFAFGQTGSGKSYTLLGNQTVAGLYQLAAHDIFAGFMGWKTKNNVQLHLWVSYYEIYCSQLFDLLNKKKKLYVRENSRGKVCIAGLMETEVHNVKGLVEVVQYGNAARSTGVSSANAQSSRSHAILQLEIRDDKDVKQGRMSFIDLAGSERATDMPDSDKQTRLEGAEINQSLLALKECIRSIDQDSSHTPYRQSKLTHILRDSFIGNSQTVMIANIAPSFSSCENTLNTLRYADRVKELEKQPQRQSPKSSSNQPKRNKPSTPRVTATNKENANVPKTNTPNTNTRRTQESSTKEQTRPLSARKIAPQPRSMDIQSTKAPAIRTDTLNEKKPDSKPMNNKPINSLNQQIPKRDMLQTAPSEVEQKAIIESKPAANPVSTMNTSPVRVNNGRDPVTRGMNNPFMPTNGMFASTPKREGGSLKVNDPSSSSPFDVSKILKDEPETPLRGHKIIKNKILEESPEIIPAGKTQSKLDKVETQVPSSERRGTIVEDIMESEPDASPMKNPTTLPTSVENQSKPATDQATAADTHNGLSDSKIHVNAERVNALDELVRHQRSALLNANSATTTTTTTTSGHVTRRPLSARSRSRSRSPSTGRAQQERGRPEIRQGPLQQMSRSPATTERQMRMREISQRSKSIESLRASLIQKEHSKSTPFLNMLPASPADSKTADSKNRDAKHVTSSEAWSPRTNHANLRSQLGSTVPAHNNQPMHQTQDERSSIDLKPVDVLRSSSSNPAIKSHDEIIAEHREVLDHLDSLLDRAKAAVDSPDDKVAIPVVNKSEDSADRPLKSILKNSGHAASQNKAHTLHDIREPLVLCENDSKARLSDPTTSLGPDVRPKEYPHRYSLSSIKAPTNGPPNNEEFLKSLADIKHIQQRHSLGSNPDRSRSSIKADTPGDARQSNSARSSKGNTPGENLPSSGNSSRGHTPGEQQRFAAGMARTPSAAIAQTGSGFVTPAATANLYGYVSGNDVVITDQDPAFAGSPVPLSGYVPPPAPKKTNACVNRSVNDLGFKGELERMERCSSQNSDGGSIKNRSWHDILSQSDDDGSLSDKKLRISRQTSREGSLEMNLNDGVRQVATIKDADTVVIETIETTNGRSTVDSGIGSHRDQSDPEADRRTNSRGSHYSLDLHSDLDTADDGISLSTDVSAAAKSRVHVAENQVHRIEQRAINRGTKSMSKRQLTPEEDEDYIPPLKLNFDEEDDELEESYCRIVESEKRRDAEERAKKRLHVHQTSAFTAVAEPEQLSIKNTHAQSLGNMQQGAESQSRGLVQSANNGSDFSPIQAFPVTPRDGHVVTAPTAMNQMNNNTAGKSVITHDKHSADGPNVRVIKHDRNTEQPLSARGGEQQPLSARSGMYSSRSAQYSINHGATSQHTFEPQPNQSTISAKSLDRQSAEFHRSVDSRPSVDASIDLQSLQAPSTGHHTALQQQLLASHEEQLAQMTALCKQEMKLLMTVKASNQDFTSYVKGLEEILSDKGRCILHLKAKIDEYLNATQQK